MVEAADGRISGVSKELRAAEILCFLPQAELGGEAVQRAYELTAAVIFFFFSEEEEI